jgi:peptidoglycan/LPS O-acetylase OafA/YrhL
VLDGLRALAIGLVLGIHSGILGNGGGFGVTIFFVLSGFLITGLLLRPRALAGRGLARFYARRLVRLYPPLAALCIFCTAWAVFVLSGHARHFLLVEVGTSMTYTTDFYLGHGHATADFGYLGHTWSLAIEEQFYLLWPLLLLLILRYASTLRARLGLVLMLWTAVVAWRAYLSTKGLAAEIGLSFGTQADALMIGCGLALAQTEMRDLVSRHQRAFDAATAVAFGALLVVSVASVPVPLGLGYVAVSLSAAVIICRLLTPPEYALGTRVKAVFAAAPVVFLGRISYSLYLWHVVVFTIAERNLGVTSRAQKALFAPLILSVAFGLAYASFRWIELPAHRLNDRWFPVARPSRPIAGGLAGARAEGSLVGLGNVEE